MFETPLLKIAEHQIHADWDDKALSGAHTWEGALHYFTKSCKEVLGCQGLNMPAGDPPYERNC